MRKPAPANEMPCLSAKHAAEKFFPLDAVTVRYLPLTGSLTASKAQFFQHTGHLREVAMADISRLPAPRASDWEWQMQGACRGVDSATFFHPENERGPSRLRRERAAKQICASCPVAQACLNWALRTREPYGVWGGKSTEERAQLIRRQAS